MCRVHVAEGKGFNSTADAVNTILEVSHVNTLLVCVFAAVTSEFPRFGILKYFYSIQDAVSTISD